MTPPATPPPGIGTDSMPRAMLWMLLSGFSFALMGAMVKLAGDAPLSTKVFFRNLVTLLITSGVALRMRQNPLAIKGHWTRLLLRSFCGLAGVFLYFLALGELNLADASLLNKTSPFFVAVFAVLMLKEPFSRALVPILAIAFTGAMMVIKPTFDYDALPALAGLGSGMFAGMAYTLVRSLKGGESPNRIVFVFSLVSTVVTAPFLLIYPPSPTGSQWLALIGTGVFAAGGQYGLTFAYHHAQASRISVFTFLHVLFSLAVGFVLWDEQPDLWSWVGGVMIVAAAIGMQRVHRRERG